MKAHPIVALALFWGILGASQGQTAQAQSSGQLLFAQMILSKEAKQVFAAQSAINRQNYDVQRVQVLSAGATTASMRRLIFSLTREINRLQTQINRASGKLQSLNPLALLATAPSRRPAASAGWPR